MTQKIKLMSDELEKELLDRRERFRSDPSDCRVRGDIYIRVLEEALDECEKRATEKMREAFIEGWTAHQVCKVDDVNGYEQGTSLWIAFQQYLKEPSLSQPPSLDNVQGFLDLTKEQDGE